MEDYKVEENNNNNNNNNNNHNSRKRVRDDSDFDSPELKLTRVDSFNSDIINSPVSTLHRVGSGNSVVISFQDDLFDILDDSDIVNGPDPAIQGLDSVIRSFEEEILVPPPPESMTSYTGESQPELGYLLEASDDELGLPPSFSSGDEEKISAVDLTTSGSGIVGFGDMLGFEDEMPSYDSFGFGIGGDSDNGSDFVTLGDGLFDLSEESYEPADVSEFSWRPESLPAL